MAKSNTLEIIIKAKDAASGAFKNAGSATDIFRKRVKSLTGTVFNLKTAFAGLGLGLLARDLIQSSDEQAKAVMGLETAMKSMGRYTPELSAELQDLASSMQEVTNFGDEATIAGQKFLMTYKDITDDLLPRSTKVMLDLAALMDGDLVSAANKLGKASMGMTGELTKMGISVTKQTYELEGYEGVLREIETQVKGQARAMREATGPWIAIGMAIGDVKEKLGDVLKKVFNDTGENLLFMVSSIDRALGQFKESVDFEEWAKNFKNSILSAFESALFGAAAFYDGIKPIMHNIKVVLSSVWDVFEKLPAWVQDVGLVTAILGGKKVAASIAGLAHLANAAENTARGIKLVAGGQLELSEFAEMDFEELAFYLENFDERIKTFKIHTEEAVKPTKDLWAEFSGAETATEKVKILIQHMKQLRAEQTKPAADTSSPTTASTVSPGVSAAALSKSHLMRLKEETKTALAKLKSLYEQGKKTLDQYFAERRAKIEEQYNAEIEALQKLADAETKDPGKKLAIEDKIFQKKEEHARILLELTQQQIEAEDALGQKKLEVEEMLADMRQRAETETGSGLDAGFAEEQAEMDARHQEESETFKTLLDDKLAAELGYIDEADALKDVSRKQQLEKDKLLADQEERLLNARLATAKDVAAGLQDAFTTLYEASGKKQKEFFYLAKAAAIAQTLISTYQAAMGAYASLATIPYVGWALGAAAAAVIVAAGMAKVSMIRSQGLAAGGEVRGHSPSETSDNIPIWATAKEFVQPVPAVKYYGKRVMEAMRKRLIPREIFQGFALPDIPAMRPTFAYAAGGSVAVPERNDMSEEKQQEITIINVTDAREIDSYLASSAGQDAVLNVLSSKTQTVRKILR